MDFEVLREDLRFLLTRFKRPLVGWHDPNFGVRFDDYLDMIEDAVPSGSIDFVAESSLSLLSEPHLKRLKRNSFKGVLPGRTEHEIKRRRPRTPPGHLLHAGATWINGRGHVFCLMVSCDGSLSGIELVYWDIASLQATLALGMVFDDGLPRSGFVLRTAATERNRTGAASGGCVTIFLCPQHPGDSSCARLLDLQARRSLSPVLTSVPPLPGRVRSSNLVLLPIPCESSRAPKRFR